MTDDIDFSPLVEGAEVKKAIELIESYLAVRAVNTQKAYRAVYTEWLTWCQGSTWLPNRKFLRATQADGIEYFGHLQTKPGVPSRDGRSRLATHRTVVRKIEILRAMYRWLKDNGKITGVNPFEFPLSRKDPVATKRPTRALTDDQVIRVLGAFPGPDYESVMSTAILSLMFGLALRRGEIVHFRMADVFPETKEIVIAKQKNQRRTTMLMPDWVWAALLRYLVFRDGAETSEFLFTKISGPHCERSPGVGETVIKRIFKQAIKRAGLPANTYSPHSARATAITAQYDNGRTTREIQDWARHASGAMTETYDKRRNQFRVLTSKLEYKKSA